MIKVALTGSTGLVGSRIIELLKEDFEFIPFIYPRMDITNRENVRDIIRDIDFDIFLHLAAYTNVNRAEEEKKIAYKLNVTGTRNVFESVMKKDKKFIYVSTEFVFNGTNPDAIFDESSTPNPLGVYGTTKYEGEKIVKDRAMIMRISHPYRREYATRPDFVRNLKSLLEQGKELKMVQDSLITPTFIDDVAVALKHLINNFSPEIFHIVGSDSLSPYDAGLTIAKMFKLDKNLISPTTFAEYFKDSAKSRPQYTPVTSKKNDFHKMRSFEEGLRLMI